MSAMRGIVALGLMWILTLPVALLAVGFAGDRLWSVSAIEAELSAGDVHRFLVRLGFLFYFLVPAFLGFEVYRVTRQRGPDGCPPSA